MRYLRGLLLATLWAMALSSCSEDVDLEKERRSVNEANFLSFADSAGYVQTYLPGLSGDSYVYINKLKEGTGTTSPRYTDRVTFHYRGFLTSDWVRLGANAASFDNNLSTETSLLRSAQVNGHIPGLSLALQTMVVGDKVRVIIPWYLAYGPVSSGPIPSYSSLVFELELVSIL